jgi:hypothetical protein
MRFLAILLGAAAIGSCTTAPPSPDGQAMTAREQAELAQLTAGKVAGAPVTCLPHYYTKDMITIDDRTVASRVSRGRVYLNGMNGGCPSLRPPYALVTRQFGTANLCRGDIAQVVDTSTGASFGSCVFGNFIPYTRPGA